MPYQGSFKKNLISSKLSFNMTFIGQRMRHKKCLKLRLKRQRLR